MSQTSEDTKAYLQQIISNLPENPGCYLYLDESEVIIYVGKAKNLKKRVSSYFNKNQDAIKTRILVKKIRDIQYVVVSSEEDALLLENNMIKEHQPRYNILLKDDKTYPWIVVKKERFPRVFQTRTLVKDKSSYYGPYPSLFVSKMMVKLIHQLYPIRICNYPLLSDNIDAGKYKVCLQYHIKNCLGPCQALQSEEDYNKDIFAVQEILKGNVSQISKKLFDEMKTLAEELRFEEAQKVKEKYRLIENYRAKSIVVSTNLNNIDVFSFDKSERSAYINYLHVSAGSIIRSCTIEYKLRIEEKDEVLLSQGIIELRLRFKSQAKEIIVPFVPDMQLNGVVFSVPQRGDKKELLHLSEKNVGQYKIDQLKQAEKLNPEQRGMRIMQTMQKDLNLKELPLHIECFDNSNLQGTNAVSACVVFKNARPSKKDYRHFNIKTVVGPDDFASMYEAMVRRYSRLLEEQQPLPQLIIVDGGKGQLSISVKALHDLNLTSRIAIIGIAKRLEEIYFPDDPIPLYIDKNSETLKLIQQLRDEAHRFGITFHRNKRSKQQIESELDSIKGIGELTKMSLLKHFKSIKKIKEASLEEIVELIGKKKAEIIFRSFT